MISYGMFNTTLSSNNAGRKQFAGDAAGQLVIRTPYFRTTGQASSRAVVTGSSPSMP
jgi:hypothetical protein